MSSNHSEWILAILIIGYLKKIAFSPDYGVAAKTKRYSHTLCMLRFLIFACLDLEPKF